MDMALKEVKWSRSTVLVVSSPPRLYIRYLGSRPQGTDG